MTATIGKITESIIISGTGKHVHVAPFGVQFPKADNVWIAPFKPSRTLDNLTSHPYASINLTDDPLVFAGCLTGRRDFPLRRGKHVDTMILEQACSAMEIEVRDITDDPTRVRITGHCVARHAFRPWGGFNRARAAVIEGCIALSRWGILDSEWIDAEMRRLAIIVEKTAGKDETTAWQWLCDHHQDCHKRKKA